MSAMAFPYTPPGSCFVTCRSGFSREEGLNALRS